MTHTNRTTPCPDAATLDAQIAFPDWAEDWEDEGQVELRRQLGLRPIVYAAGNGAKHPDGRECPSWCWAAPGDAEHELETSNMFSALHYYEGAPTVALSQYRARRFIGEEAIQPATLRLVLQQRGQGVPHIEVWFHGSNREGRAVIKLAVALGIDDAQDLVAVLQHLVGLTDS